MDITLRTPESFPAFPYAPPYEIQVELMRHLYASIEKRQVAIIESPTGTGKTLTLLCSSLTWLRDNKNRVRQGILEQAVASESSEPQWVIDHMMKRKRSEMEAEDQEYEKKLMEARKRDMIARKIAKSRVTKKPRHSEPKTAVAAEDEENDRVFLPEDDDAVAEEVDGLTPQARAILAKIEQSKNPQKDSSEEPTCTKIFYASRTHSQLSQVLPELERLKLKLPSLEVINLHDNTNKRSASCVEEEEEDSPACSTRAVSLGSRKQLCINEDLKKRSKDIDESCRELLGEKGPKRCQFLPPVDEEIRMLDFRDEILAAPKDIEELALVGRASGTCPYFGSRRAIPQAELVTLPYNLLLQKTAREALGIDLTDHIVIIDEAHNLIPTLLSLSTSILTFTTLETSLHQVGIYLSKFRQRLSPINVLYLKRLVLFLDTLKSYAATWREGVLKRLKEAPRPKGSDPRTEVLTLSDLVERLGTRVANINLLEIEQYLKKSKVARKIAGYSDKQTEKEAAKDGKHHVSNKGAVPPLHAVENFMIAISGSSEDGRITLSLVGKPGHESLEIKYQHLNPAPHFSEVTESARSVILAGGTMSPISDVVYQLFPSLLSGKLTTFSCGHIIPEANLKPLVVCKGPRGGELEYKAGKQGDAGVLAELGQIIANLTNVVPAGMVVFFPSYSFLNLAKSAWADTVLPRLATKKKVFFEPDQSSDVERILQEYGVAAKMKPAENVKGGALLFAVIGAKLSEGLNFTDDLARAVVIIGMPFANLGSPELRERMKYVKRMQEKIGKTSGQRDAAEELYENMCMNAVNQSIGRAIRHRGDWSSLILLDHRYEGRNVRNKLPKWIGGSLVVAQTFGQVMKELGGFYKAKKTS